VSSARAEMGDRLARFSPGAPPASPAACAHLAGVAALARARALAAPLAGAGAPPPLAPLLAALEVRGRGVWGAVGAVCQWALR
jgi:hypothetical protein